MQSKICCKCQQLKSFEEFNKNNSRKDGRQTYCRICSIKSAKYSYSSRKHELRQVFAERADIKRRKIVAQIGQIKADTGCIFCKEKEPSCLDFHHTDNTKDKSVSYFAHAKSITKALKEIEKCIILCANCHRKLHAGIISLS